MLPAGLSTPSINSVSGVFLLVFSLIALSSTRMYAQEDDDLVQVKNLEPRTVLTTLFESTNYSSQRGIGWKPRIDDRINFNPSDDGYLYTRIDTVMYFSDLYSQSPNDRAAVILYTNAWYGNEVSSCHACAPEMGVAIFTRLEKSWVLTTFVRDIGQFGGWGEPGEASLFPLGPDQMGLMIESGYTGQGYTESYMSIFDLGWYDGVPKVLFLKNYANGPAGCEEECTEEWCENYYDIERTIISVPNDDQLSYYPNYSHFQIHTVEKDCSGKTIADYTTTYRMTDGQYAPTCEN